MALRVLDKAQIQARPDAYLEVEFSYRNTEVVAELLADLQAETQVFILDWVKRIASTNIEIAYQLARYAIRALESMDEHMLEAWVLQAMDVYDRSGLHSAVKVVKEIDLFVRQGRERASGCVLEEQMGVLLPFVQGLSGRKLRLDQADELYTDSEVIFLPGVMAHLPDKRDNFLLYKRRLFD